MNGADQISPSTTLEIEQRAASWLQRRRYWNWSADDQTALDAWLNESLAHGVAFWRLEAGLGQAERLVALKPALPETDVSPRRRILPLLFGGTAAAAILAAVIFGVSFFEARNLRSYATTVGGQETLALADGSQIQLNTDTVVRLSADTSRRELYLDKGEVYFQIKHDPKRPFVVHVGDNIVTDLGTKFLIRRDEGRMEVAVMEGRVRFDTENESTKSKLLTAGDTVLATANKVVSDKKPLAVLSDQLGWQRGLIVFDHEPLDAAAAEFNRYNSRKLVIADAQTARLTIDGKFQANNVELFARVARDVLRLRVETRGNDTVISR